MRGTDKVAITFGDAIFREFRIDGLGDYASEKIIQHVFSIRGFVNPADSANLIIAQAKNEGLLRSQTLQRIRASRAFMAADTEPVRNAQSVLLAEAWEKFKTNTSTPEAAAAGRSAVKDARLAVVVMLIEGVNFSKLIGDCATKGDLKSQISLLASGLSISSALFDVASVPAKNLFGSGSWSYQTLKMWGGFISGVATIVGVGLDTTDAVKSFGKGYSALAAIYTFKAGIGFVSGGLTLAVTFTYSAPLIARVTGRVVMGTVVREVGRRAAAIIGLRILGMAAGGWITLSLFGIQVLIWTMTPNALEDWLDHCAFGKLRSDGGYRTGKQQDEALEHALVTMGFK